MTTPQILQELNRRHHAGLIAWEEWLKCSLMFIFHGGEEE